MISTNNKEGYLEAGDEHSIYFETYGNPKGINILFLHGGPGGRFTDRDKRFFDRQIFNLILFDQRGCGRSKPSEYIQNNTTQKLIADITKLLNHLQIDKTILFGGSWGSTLAMLYAIERPNKVSAMILRGVFTASRKNRQQFENGRAKLFFPKAWKRFAQLVPDNQKTNVLSYYYNKILSSNGKTRKKYSYELIRYIMVISRKNINENELSHSLESIDFVCNAVLQSHYSIHDFFLPDNYILDNLESIDGIPTYIVHGKHDMICPPEFALKVAEKLQNSKLFLVDAGHSSQEPKIVSKLNLILDMPAITNSLS